MKGFLLATLSIILLSSYGATVEAYSPAGSELPSNDSRFSPGIAVIKLEENAFLNNMATPHHEVGKPVEQRLVRGTVVDSATGKPLVGVTVKVNGGTTGTTTDAKGQFTLNVPDGAALEVSYLGYSGKVVHVDGKTTLTIQLAASATGLNQLVVVGYETMRRKDVTGAISTISAKDLVMSSAPDLGHMLEGKLPGLYIQQNSAQPGGGLDMLIRGGGSINASNAPLIVIDGFPISDVQQPGTGGIYQGGTFSPLNSLNPNDVESITVLKDASATAIYGSRAANGVILITTKSGSLGKPTVQYSANYSVQPYVNKFKELSLGQWMQVYNDAAWENWLWTNQVQPWGPNTIAEAEADPVAGQYHKFFSQKAIDNVGKGTDWVGLITRTGSTMQHNLSISGGGKAVKYFLSGNYYDQKGVVKNSELKRISFRSNFDIKLSKILTLKTSLSESRINNYNTQLGDAPYEQSGIITAALEQGPQIRARDENGNYPVNPLVATQPNPLGLLTITDQGKIENTILHSSLLIQPEEHINFRLEGGVERGIAQRGNYVPTTTVRGAEENGIANIAGTNNNHYLLQATADYRNTFGDAHAFDILFGASEEKFVDDGNSENVSNFITDAFLMYDMGAGTGPKTLGSSHQENAIASYFGRINYRFKDKYFFTFSARTDGSSVFANGHKWGFFPSAALAWDITKENFFQSLSNTISQLKVRLSYGQTGNASIGTNAFAAYYAHPSYLSGSDQVQIGVSPNKLENPDLTWETTTEANIGIDYSILGNRVSGSLDFYNKVISNLLATEQLDSYQAIDTVTGNIGETQSKGFGLSITTVNIEHKDFTWRTRLTLSRFYNTWKERDPNWKPAVYQHEHDPVNAMYSLLSDRILQTGDKVPAAEPELVPGQIVIKDINGFVRDANGNPAVDKQGRFELTGKPDGKIDDADYVLIGNGDPSLTGGLVNIITYKDFTLNISFNAMFGRRMEDPNFMLRGRNAYDIFQDGLNDLTTVLNRWTPTNPSTTQPSTYQDWSPYGNGDFFLQKAWFIRFQDISLLYRLPHRWFRGVFNEASLHLAANNLLLITPYTGVDPETDAYAAAYPNMSTYTFGVNLEF
jgi:TonB-linked SusC/RagA family outer membrane protein